MDSVLLLAQCFVAAALAGLCWTVQLAVYALFAPLLVSIGADAFRAHHAAYTRAMGWIAAPLMIAELGLAVAWLLVATDAALARTGLALVGAIWVLTFVVIVPAHARIQSSPTETAARRLVRLNLLRTALWTARAALLAYAALCV
ncbi:MAG: hypothetical protein H7067_06200 [Burkholderiales bacterium]|nr:hypothetical protein [Opitutaceae bacterium]